MDHLPHPKHPVWPLEGPYRASYVCTAPYDQGNFLGYPLRAGFPEALPHADRSPFFWLEKLNPSDDKTILEPFLQAWVFFGLLCELLNPFCLYKEEDYIETVNGTKFVHTQKLEVTIKAWAIEVQNLTIEEKIAKQRHLIQCLKVAASALRCFLPSAELGLLHPNFNRAIYWSIVAVCEAISDSGDMHLDKDPLLDWPLFDLFASFNEREIDHMKANGWCSASIAHAERTFGNVACHLFFLYMDMSDPSRGADHKACTSDHCKYGQIDPANYKLQHVRESCDCETLGPSPTRVAHYLDADTFPIIQVSGAEGTEVLSMEVSGFQSEKNTPYVAISHVWADGLGNQLANALQRCQVVRLWKLAKCVEGQSFLWGDMPITEERSLSLWCDSLLCPVEIPVPPGMTGDELAKFRERKDVQRASNLKSASLRKMREVYSQASYVLVLDRALLPISVSEVGLTEATIRLLTCGWMQRLWTFQEAVLPVKLLVQFSDGLVDHRMLWQHTTDMYRYQPLQRSMYRTLAYSCMDLRANSIRGMDRRHLRLLSIGSRKCSDARDEPLCAATLLGLDLGRVSVERSHGDRMAALWHSMSESSEGIPGSIVFGACDRLSKPGFCWAPATFQGHSVRADPVTGLIEQTNADPAKVTELGLEIRRSRWAVTLKDPPWAGKSSPAWTGTAHHDFVYVRFGDDEWYSLSKQRSLSSGASEQSLWGLMRTLSISDRCHVLLDDREDEQTDTQKIQGIQGLIGSYDLQLNGNRVFRSRMAIWVNRIHPAHVVLLEAAAISAMIVQQSPEFWAYQRCQFAYMALEAFLYGCPKDVGEHPDVVRAKRVLPMIRWRRTLHTVRCMIQIFRHGNLILGAEVVQRAIDNFTPKITPPIVHAYIGLHMSGKLAHIVKVFGRSEVIVD